MPRAQLEAGSRRKCMAEVTTASFGARCCNALAPVSTHSATAVTLGTFGEALLSNCQLQLGPMCKVPLPGRLRCFETARHDCVPSDTCSAEK